MSKLKKFIQIKKNLNKLNSLSGSTDYNTIKILGKTIPERWCPEISPKVRSQDLPPILSENILNVDGGSP